MAPPTLPRCTVSSPSVSRMLSASRSEGRLTLNSSRSSSCLGRAPPSRMVPLRIWSRRADATTCATLGRRTWLRGPVPLGAFIFSNNNRPLRSRHPRAPSSPRGCPWRRAWACRSLPWHLLLSWAHRGLALGDEDAAETRIAVRGCPGDTTDVVLDGADGGIEEDRHAVLHLLHDEVVGLAVEGGASAGVAGALGLLENRAKAGRLVAAGVGRALGEEVVVELLVGIRCDHTAERR